MAPLQIGRLTSSVDRLAKEKVELETQFEAEEEQARGGGCGCVETLGWAVAQESLLAAACDASLWLPAY